MLCYAKKVDLFLKSGVFFTAGLFISNVSNAQNDYDILSNGTIIEKVSCTETDCFFPGKEIGGKTIHIIDKIDWDRNENLVLHTRGNIVFEKEAKITGKKNGAIILKAGMEPGEKEDYPSTIIFEGDGESAQIKMEGSGKVDIYYNPSKELKKHKYRNANHNFYNKYVYVGASNSLRLYMLVNDVYDLQNIRLLLFGNYALSQNIKAHITNNWNNKKGFEPLRIKNGKNDIPFSGNFDGNGYTIEGLFINRPDEDEVGLFGSCQGHFMLHNTIKNLTLKEFDITGRYYVGGLAGSTINSDLVNIRVINAIIKSKDIAGGLTGSAFKTLANAIYMTNAKIATDKKEGFIVGGLVVGGVKDSRISFAYKKNKDSDIGQNLFLGNANDQAQICFPYNATVSDIKLCCFPSEDMNFKDLVYFTTTYNSSNFLLND